MKAFTLAALPWILAGLAVAIICAGMDKQKSPKKAKEAEDEDDDEQGNYIPYPACCTVCTDCGKYACKR